MKKLKYIALSLAFILGTASCDDYLDVNTDPDNPISEQVSPQLRLTWIQNYYTYAWGTACMRTNTIAGLMTQVYGTSANNLLSSWNPAQSSCTTIYQNLYLGAGVNIDPLIAKADELGAYHYEAAAYCIKAMGFMMMLDLHGELPIQEAFLGKTNPAYDDGKKMYQLCMEYLDKAIENFGKAQSSTAVDLSAGDLWNKGSIDKWVKLCYGLKARYLLKLSKKAEYDPTAILAALEKAPTSNDDNIIMKNYNVPGDETNFTVSDPYQASAIWDCTGYGATQRLTRWYINLLTNNFTGGSGIVDPRMSKLVPAMMTNVKLDKDGKIASYSWLRDVGVDVMESSIRNDAGPVASQFVTGTEKSGYDAEKGGFVLTYDLSKADADSKAQFIADAQAIHKTSLNGDKLTVIYQKGAAYCNTTDYKRAGDTIYVNMRANSMSSSGRSVTDMYYYPDTKFDYVGGTGTFYARPNSDTDILTYSEMCFIKAEVLFRKGDKDAALDAYKKGIVANFDRMQTKLKSWQSENKDNPDQQPMDETEIANYLSSAAVCQNAGALTMDEIMRQKLIAMGINLENWNDMRRLDYSKTYVDYKRPHDFSATGKMTGTTESDPTYWFRRLSQSTHESNYNLTQLKASNKQAMTDPIWSCPVWWDCATDDEYYGYIK